MRKCLSFLFALALATSLGLVTVGTQAQATTQTLLYDLDFGTPPHTVGLPPVIGAGAAPRKTVSSINFGTPIVVSDFSALTDQPLKFDSFDGQGDQIQLNLRYMTLGNYYVIEAEIVIADIETFVCPFGILLDTPEVRTIDFRSDGTITAWVPTVWGGQIGTFAFDSKIDLRIEVDLVDDLWKVYINGVSAHSGGFGGATQIRSIRFSTDVLSPPRGASATIDNVRVTVFPDQPSVSVTTGAATDITANEATLNMSYDFADYGTGEVRFAYKESTEVDWMYTSWVTQSDAGSYAETVSVLVSDTDYDFKAQLRYNTTEIEGALLHFTTNKIPPDVETYAATDITTDGATLNMSYDFADYDTGEVRFAYKESTEVDWTYTSWVTQSDAGSYAETVSVLVSDTYYDFKAQLQYDSTVTEGDLLHFATEKMPPAVTTNKATDITDITAILQGQLDSLGDYSPVDVSFEYGETQGGPYPKETTPEAMTADGAFSAALSSLTPAASYHFRAKADAGDGVIVYGDEQTFTTYSLPPVVWVDNDFNDSTPGWGHDAFATIQNGVNGVEDIIGMVNVHDGTYAETVGVTKSVNIQSVNGAGTTTVEVLQAGWPVFLVLEDYVTITGFTVAGHPDVFGIDIERAGYSTVSDCVITDFEVGIRLIDSNNNRLENNIIRDNEEGIRFSNSNNNEVLGNDILDNISSTSGIHLNSDSSGNIFQFNNIVGNADYGLFNENTSENVSAVNNWWGDDSGPSGEGPGVGDNVTTYVDYEPWLMVGVDDATSDTITDATLDARAEADTEVEVAGNANVTVAKYQDNPGAGFGNDIGKYIDVYINDTTATDNITVRLYYTDAEISGKVESSLQLHWWDGTAWAACSDTGVNMDAVNGYSGYMWAIIDNTTEPSLDNIDGTPFGATADAAPSPSGGGGGGGGGARGLTAFSSSINPEGQMVSDVTALSSDVQAYIVLKTNTYCLDHTGSPVYWIFFKALEDDDLPVPPEGSVVITPYYEIEPYGTIFIPPAPCTFRYKLWGLPAGANPGNLVVMAWDKETEQWRTLQTQVNAEDKSVTVMLAHLSMYTVMLVPHPAEFELSMLRISPTEVDINEEVIVTIQVTNIGELDGDCDVVLKVNGETVEEKVVTLAAGDSEDVVFALSKEVAGTYMVDINGLSGEFAVTAPPEPEPTQEPEPVPITEPEPEPVQEPEATPAEPEPSPEIIPTEESTEEQAIAVAWWIPTAIILVVVIAGIALWLIIRKRRSVKIP